MQELHKVGNLEGTSDEDFDRIYRVNVKGVYNCLSAALPAMKKRRTGVVLNMASIASSAGLPDRFAYSMGKGAVLAMTYSVARDYISHNIRCNCISPARVFTPLCGRICRTKLSRPRARDHRQALAIAAYRANS